MLRCRAGKLLIFALLGAGCALDFTKKSGSEGDASLEDQPGGENAGGQQGGENAGQSGSAGSMGNRPDAGPEPDVDVVAECSQPEDCGDLERYTCTDERCVEHACHAQRPCAGADQCDAHRCVPFTPPERFPAGYFQSSGGGSASSSMFKLRLASGSPQPMGLMTSSNFKMKLGPAGAGL